MMGSSIVPLRKKAPPMVCLVELWLKFKPLDAVTLEPVSCETAFEEVKELSSMLEASLYVLLERSTP
jgi:hypothetical protein